MNKIRNKKGQSMVEFALILPVFLLLLLGMVDLSRVISANFVLDNAARSAARIGVISNDDDDIETVINNATTTLNDSPIVINITPDEDSRSSGDELSVEITYTVDIITPIVSNIIGGSIDISGKTIMRIE